MVRNVIDFCSGLSSPLVTLDKYVAFLKIGLEMSQDKQEQTGTATEDFFRTLLANLEDELAASQRDHQELERQLKKTRRKIEAERGGET